MIIDARYIGDDPLLVGFTASIKPTDDPKYIMYLIDGFKHPRSYVWTHGHAKDWEEVVTLKAHVERIAVLAAPDYPGLKTLDISSQLRVIEDTLKGVLDHGDV